ncbi:helix-turn-helix domain-containing protein [Geotalea toluenoxydans]
MVVIGKPAQDLAGQVQLWWSAQGGGAGGRGFYEVPPDGNMNLIFRFSASGWRMSLLGPRTEKACVEIDEASDYFCLSFNPGQTPRLADVRPSELVDTFADLPGLGGMSSASLADRLHSLRDPLSRKLVMEELVRGSLPLVRDERCRHAATLLKAHGGQLRIDELAAGLGLHVRSLERLFIGHLGVSPKQLARLIRFNRLACALRAGNFASLADIAYACGYADQSHMIREYKEFTGCVPGEIGSCDMRPVTGAPGTRIVHRFRS